jgi:GWxTD domain-containing protein
MRKSVFSPYKTFSVFHLPPARCLIFLFCLFLLVSCASYKLEKTLDPESQEFLSKVRFITTRQERKIFLNIAPSERKNFIEEFWKKRDPDPDTEENEFKKEYFNRIEEANHLFREGGSPGWLQDRGRIYILLGPPDNRSARYISEINKAQMQLKPKVKAKEVVFDFNLRVKKVKEDEMLIQIEVPYKNIWLAEKENKLETILELSVEIFDSLEKKVWKHQKNYPISLTKEDLEEIVGKGYSIEIPVSLGHGNYTLTAELENRTDESKVIKKIKFNI